MKKNTMIQKSKRVALGVLFILVVGFVGACGGGSGPGQTTTVQNVASGINTAGTLVPIVNQPTDLRKALCVQAGNRAVKCRFPGMQFASTHQGVDSLFAKYKNIQ